jgi:enoyl-[acyl-carrier protein] reductase I
MRPRDRLKAFQTKKIQFFDGQKKRRNSMSRKGLIVGIADTDSIAWGCAKALSEVGSDLLLTYQFEQSRPYIEALGGTMDATAMVFDVTKPDQQEAVFDTIRKKWGKLDFLLHAVAYAPKADLQGRLTDCSRDGFLTAMDVSCHSLIRLAKAAEPLMTEGGNILTLSYYGADKVIDNYNLMGPVKAALEASVRYLAADLGNARICVNALSPGPVATRAASGLAHFDLLMQKAADQAPIQQRLTIEEIGDTAAFLLSNRARHISGQVIYVDNGSQIRG